MNLALLLFLVGPGVFAGAGVPGGSTLDGSGTPRLDGGEALPRGETRMAAHVGATQADTFSSLVGLGFLTNPWGPVEVGVGLPDIRQRWGAERPPAVDPGALVLQVRTAALPRLEGLAVGAALSAPVAPIAGLDEPLAFGAWLALGRHVGRVRPVLDLGWSVDRDGHTGWGGAGARVDLRRERRLTAELTADSHGRWGAGIGAEWPLFQTARLGLDLCRRAGSDAPAELEGVVRVSFGSQGFWIDRDRDGVADEDDHCPGAKGVAPDGCPVDEVASGCDCPFDDMSLDRIQGLLDGIRTAPGSSIMVFEVRVRDSGDLRSDWEQTQRVVQGMQRFLEGNGAPPDRFEILGVAPGPGDRPWSMLTREMPRHQFERQRGAKAFDKPE